MTVVAVVGGGQLARMMAPAATAMGVTLRVLVESETASAALAAHEVVVGLPTDPQAIEALLAHPTPAVVTWEHEHIPNVLFEQALGYGVAARPAREALTYARDKIAMRSRLADLDLPMPSWAAVDTYEDVAEFLARHRGRAVLKTATGGYDGKGVRVISDPEQAQDWLRAASDGGPRVLIEEMVAFDRELAIQAARNPSGDMVVWPLVESVQKDGVCAEVIAPAPGTSSQQRDVADQMARRIATALDVTGVLAVEMFEVNGSLLINELAMRPHNSGHWTIEGSVTSQFEQHLRAVLDWPLGDTAPLAPVTVMANILGGSRTQLVEAWQGIPDTAAKIHLYGKSVLPGRKVGHVTVMGEGIDTTRSRAAAVAEHVKNGGK